MIRTLLATLLVFLGARIARAEPRLDETQDQSPYAAVLHALRTNADYPPTEDAARLLLRAYAEERKPEDLDRAAAIARRLGLETSPAKSVGILYEIAHAGGPTFIESERLLPERISLAGETERYETYQYALLPHDFLLRAMVLGNGQEVRNALLLAGEFFDTRTRGDWRRKTILAKDGGPGSLPDFVETLRIALTVAEASGTQEANAVVASVAAGLVHRFWSETTGRLRLQKPVDASSEAHWNARAAIALREAGVSLDDRFLSARAERILDAVLEEALLEPVSAPAAALAFASLAEDPVQIILAGDPASEALADLRLTAFFLFEPRKVITTLDPATDRDRLDGLGLPVDRPALVVRVGDLVSPPVTSGGELRGVMETTLATKRRTTQ